MRVAARTWPSVARALANHSGHFRPLPGHFRPLARPATSRPLPGHFEKYMFFPIFSPPATSRPLPAATCEATSRPLPGHMGGCEVGRRPLPGHFAACEVSSRPHLSRQLETPHSRAVPSQGTQEVKRCAQQAPKEGVLPCARPPPQGTVHFWDHCVVGTLGQADHGTSIWLCSSPNKIVMLMLRC